MRSVIMKAQKIIIIVLCITGIITSVFGGVWLANSLLTEINPVTTQDGQEIQGDEILGGRINILMMGTDHSGSLSDTIMLASLDVKQKKVSVLSIYRDTRVNSGQSYCKINSLIGTKDKELATINAVKKITGLPINYYVTVNFQAFRDIIDTLGGVEFDVPNAPTNFSAGRKGIYYDDPAQNLHIAIKEGMQKLNGEQAEGLVRFRYGYPEADVARVRVQQQFLKAIMDQKLNVSNITKTPKIFQEIQKNVRTNLSIAQINNIVKTIKNIKPEDIQTYTLPGAPQMINGASYFIVDTKETKTLVSENFSNPSEASNPSKSTR